jgi:hypothetical protein
MQGLLSRRDALSRGGLNQRSEKRIFRRRVLDATTFGLRAPCVTPTAPASPKESKLAESRLSLAENCSDKRSPLCCQWLRVLRQKSMGEWNRPAMTKACPPSCFDGRMASLKALWSDLDLPRLSAQLSLAF